LWVREWSLLESALPVTLVVDGGVSVLHLQFCSVVAAVKRWVGGAFHRFLQLDVWMGSVQDLTPGDIILHQMFVWRVGLLVAR